ncbi:hypothetical protein TrVGV298_006425 [Trichoderma virens]|nr:hypothetical protein TrVGV298_006425 [Trichoderma virens]
MTRLRVLSIVAFFCVLGNTVALPQGYSDEPKFDLKPLLIDPIRKWSLNTTVSFPNSPAFNASTERWTIADPPTYIAAIRPGTEEDIGKVINLARTKRFPFLTRGAGHGYSASLGAFQHGLSLDLSQWKTLKIDKKAQTLTVGPGVTFAEIFDPLFKAGFYIQTGSCSCPSMIGVTIGGRNWEINGMTMSFHFAGKYGLLMDALQSVRMVGAGGKVMRVSATSHPDLWWGILGAGANFGVITSATYKVHPLVNNGNVFIADFYLPVERSREYFDIVEANYSNMSANLAQIMVASWNRTTSSAGFEKIEKYFYDHPGGRDTTLVFENFPNQAVAAIPDASTAFPWRDFKGFIQINFAWTAGDDATAQASNKLGKELRNQFATTSGYSEKAIFVNYAHGDESIENIYGRRKLPRLAQLKKKYDPSNLFAYNHPLPTHYP